MWLVQKMTLFKRTKKLQILRDVRQCFTSDSAKVSQWLYLYLPVVTPWCSNTNTKNEMWELLQSLSFCPCPCFKVTVTCHYSLLLPPSTCHLHQSLSTLRVTGRLLVALYFLLTNSPALSGEVASHITSSPLHHATSLLPPLHFPPPPSLLTAPCSSDFKGPRMMWRLNSSLSQSDSSVSPPGVKSVWEMSNCYMWRWLPAGWVWT